MNALFACDSSVRCESMQLLVVIRVVWICLCKCVLFCSNPASKVWERKKAHRQGKGTESQISSGDFPHYRQESSSRTITAVLPTVLSLCDDSHWGIKNTNSSLEQAWGSTSGRRSLSYRGCHTCPCYSFFKKNHYTTASLTNIRPLSEKTGLQFLCEWAGGIM